MHVQIHISCKHQHTLQDMHMHSEASDTGEVRDTFTQIQKALSHDPNELQILTCSLIARSIQLPGHAHRLSEDREEASTSISQELRGLWDNHRRQLQESAADTNADIKAEIRLDLLAASTRSIIEILKKPSVK